MILYFYNYSNYLLNLYAYINSIIIDKMFQWNPKRATFYPRGETIIIGHRGAPSLVQENTIESFKLAFEAGLQGVELDVQITQDDKLIVFHDWEIITKNGKSNNISSLFYSEILLISKENNFYIPQLHEVLNIVPNNRFINIEIKSMKIFNTGIETQILKLLQTYNILDKTIISSFNPWTLRRIKKICPQILIALLWTNNNSPLLINTPLWVWLCKPDGFHIDIDCLDVKIIHWVKSKKMTILSYTVNNKCDFLLAKKMDLDGVFTDNPSLLYDTKN